MNLASLLLQLASVTMAQWMTSARFVHFPERLTRKLSGRWHTYLWTIPPNVKTLPNSSKMSRIIGLKGRTFRYHKSSEYGESDRTKSKLFYSRPSSRPTVQPGNVRLSLIGFKYSNTWFSFIILINPSSTSTTKSKINYAFSECVWRQNLCTLT